MSVTAEEETDTPIPTGKHPVLAGVFSALLPGAGQWYVGRWLRGLVFLIPVLVALAVAVVAQGLGTTGLLELAVQPRILWGVLVGDVLLLAWRVVAVVDAFRLADGKRGVGAHVVLVVLVFVVALPHVVVGAYGLRSIDFLETVFASDDVATEEAVVPTGLTIVPPSPEADIVPDPASVTASTSVTTTTFEFSPIERSTRNFIFREGLGDPDAVEVWEKVLGAAAAPAPFLPFDERVDPGRLTILLAGGDAGPGRGGLRTDTMIVATMDLDTGSAALFGLPRNLAQIPLPRRFGDAFRGLQQRLAPPSDPTTWVDLDGDGVPDPPPFISCKCFPEQLNAVYPFTRKWTRTYPNSVDPGMDALSAVVENILGLDIDYFALADMAAFVDLVDAIGGVEVMVTKELQAEVSPPREGDPWATVDVQPGVNHLSGPEALAYVRARKGSSDYVRMQRQRCLVRAVAAEADPLTIVRAFPAVADAIQSSVVTNIPLSFLPDLIDAAGKLDFDDIATVGLVPPYYAPGRDHKGHPIPDVGRIRWKVDKVLTEGVPAQTSDGESECGI